MELKSCIRYGRAPADVSRYELVSRYGMSLYAIKRVFDILTRGIVY